jgi:molybdopterin synthase catalytic subunit
VETELVITKDPIDEVAWVRRRKISSGMGAVVSFAGVVRSREGDQPIRAIEYESFVPMAEHQFRLIFAEIEKRWPVESIRLVHRIGVVPVNEPSLWVEVTTPHRGEAFAACQYLIEEMKRLVPIWKHPLPS